RDVNPADRMSDRTAASEPERVLVEFLADAFRLQRVFPAIELLQNCQRRAHKLIVAENAAQAHQTFIGVHSDQSVDAIVGPDFVAPAAFGRRAAQTGASDLTYFHVAISKRNASKIPANFAGRKTSAAPGFG